MKHVKCNVVMVGYRGYSDSDGTPSEKGLKIDSKTIINFVTSLDNLKHSDIFIHGRSLGGAVAIECLDEKVE